MGQNKWGGVLKRTFLMCQQHFKLESIRVPHKVVYVTGGDGID